MKKHVIMLGVVCHVLHLTIKTMNNLDKTLLNILKQANKTQQNKIKKAIKKPLPVKNDHEK